MKEFKSQMEREIYQQPHVLSGILPQNEIVLRELIAELKKKKPKLVYFAARGTSDHACMYSEYLLSIVKGIPCALSLPSVITLYDAKVDLSEALVIGVSQSGEAQDVLAVLTQANECGAITVSVTNEKNSPMAKTAKYHLWCAAGEEKSVAATKTFTSQLYVLASFFATWADDKNLISLLEQVPDAVSELLETVAPQIDAVIQRYRYMTDGFVLGRGTTYPIALEAALKLQETNYVRMKGYAVSDFYHGPLAQIEEGTPVILFAAKGPCFANAHEMLQKLDGIGAEVILVSDDAGIVCGRPLAFQIPSLESDLVSPFLFSVFAQLFACKLTEVKGLSPDHPRNLNKVTITL